MKKKLRKPVMIQSKRIRARARDFADWLNSEGATQDLFRPLVELTAAVTKHELKRKRSSDTLGPSDPYLSYEAKIAPLLRRIQKKYPSQLELVDWGDKGGLPLFARQSIRPERGEAVEAVTSLEEFYDLTGHGVFASFERCALPSCDKCFFAFPRQKRYCSDAHQRTHYDQSPERKKNNAKYQREHYRNHLSVAAKQRELRSSRSRTARQKS
jgi:hypothetical protein